MKIIAFYKNNKFDLKFKSPFPTNPPVRFTHRPKKQVSPKKNSCIGTLAKP